MQFVAILLTMVVYGAAGYLWYLQRTPVYVLALIGGHLSAFASPLWRFLYGVSFSPSLETFQAVLDQPIPTTLVFAAGWYYPLPALLVLYLYTARWWFRGYVTGLLTFLVFFLYHLLIEALGLRASLWAYNWPPLPLGVSSPALAAGMAGLISYGLLYVLLGAYRASWISLLLTVVPAVLILSILVQGILGAPLWVTLLIDGARWMVLIGLLSTMALLGWGIHIVTVGISRTE